MQVFYLYMAVAVIFGSVFIQAAQRRLMLEVYDVTCKTFTTNFKRFESNYTKVANGKYLGNNYIMYDRKFGKDFDVQIRIRLTPWNGKVSYNILDIRTNLCSVISQDLKNMLARKLVDEMIRASNFPLDCSFKANFMYKIENYTVTDKFIPAYMPFTNATFTIEFMQKSKVLASYVARFGVIPKK